MRQSQWLELIKDFDLSIQCQDNANVVPDALSKKLCHSINALLTLSPTFYKDLQRMEVELIHRNHIGKRMAT